MKTIEINAYEFSELNDEAKKTAYNTWLSNHEYFYFDENDNTLKEFCRFFDITVNHYEYDTVISDYSMKTDYHNEELSVYEQLKILESNYENMKNNARYGGSKSCELTGYYMDEVILQPVRTIIENKGAFSSYYDTMETCLDDFFEACVSDYEYSSSLEFFKEECSYLDLYFTENGKLL